MFDFDKEDVVHFIKVSHYGEPLAVMNGVREDMRECNPIFNSEKLALRLVSELDLFSYGVDGIASVLEPDNLDLVNGKILSLTNLMAMDGYLDHSVLEMHFYELDNNNLVGLSPNHGLMHYLLELGYDDYTCTGDYENAKEVLEHKEWLTRKNWFQKLLDDKAINNESFIIRTQSDEFDLDEIKLKMLEINEDIELRSHLILNNVAGMLQIDGLSEGIPEEVIMEKIDEIPDIVNFVHINEEILEGDVRKYKSLYTIEGLK